jgi:hypothetical protein
VARLAGCGLVVSVAIGCGGDIRPSTRGTTAVSVAPTAGSTAGASASAVATAPVQNWPPAQILAAGPTARPCAAGGKIPKPARPSGWPVALGADPQLGPTGPDGTSYFVQAMRLTAVDAAGHEPAGWPIKLGIPALDSSGYAPTAVAVGPDGTVYVTGGDRIEAYRPDGKPVPGWPYRADHIPYPAFLATLLPVADGVYTDINAGEITLLGKDGSPIPGWPVALPAALADGSTSVQLRIGPDGTLYVVDGTGDAVYAYGSNGTPRPGWPLQGWAHMTFDPAGRMYVWNQISARPRRVGFGYSGPSIETDVAAVDGAGRLYPGWPLKLSGSVSPPTFGPDGTVYVTRGASRGPGSADASAASTLLAFDRTGNAKAGWPVSLPTGYGVLGSEPSVSQASADPPTIAPNGSIYVIAARDDAAGLGDNVVFAVLPNGRPAPGWPLDIGSGQLSNVLADSAGSGWLAAGNLVYVVSDNRILGLQSDGTLAPGWPLSRPCGAATLWVAQTPDGGLLVLWNAGAKPYDGTLEIRYRADGSVAGS